MIAFAPLADSNSSSFADTPPMVAQYSCRGMLPSTTSRYSPSCSFITLLRAISAWCPLAADSNSLYSREIMSSKTLPAFGWDERIKDSEHPVQSCICSQRTGTRRFFSIARTTLSASE